MLKVACTACQSIPSSKMCGCAQTTPTLVCILTSPPRGLRCLPRPPAGPPAATTCSCCLACRPAGLSIRRPTAALTLRVPQLTGADRWKVGPAFAFCNRCRRQGLLGDLKLALWYVGQSIVLAELAMGPEGRIALGSVPKQAAERRNQDEIEALYGRSACTLLVRRRK